MSLVACVAITAYRPSLYFKSRAAHEVSRYICFKMFHVDFKMNGDIFREGNSVSLIFFSFINAGKLLKEGIFS